MQESVSIIMPAFNAAPWIGNSIESVLAQSFTDWHLYIIDDASTDNTAEVVARFDDPRISYLLQPENGGVAKARNRGITAAQGRYIAFLDSDDLWEPEKLELQLAQLSRGFDVVCGNYAVFSADPDAVLATRCYPQQFDYAAMLRGNRVGNLTGIYNQQRLGKCYQQPSGHEDYLMWLELIRRAGKAFCIQQDVARYRLANQSLSANKWRAMCWQWSIYRRHLQLGWPQSCYYWLHYAAAGLRTIGYRLRRLWRC